MLRVRTLSLSLCLFGGRSIAVFIIQPPMEIVCVATRIASLR